MHLEKQYVHLELLYRHRLISDILKCQSPLRNYFFPRLDILFPEDNNPNLFVTSANHVQEASNTILTVQFNQGVNFTQDKILHFVDFLSGKPILNVIRSLSCFDCIPNIYVTALNMTSLA